MSSKTAEARTTHLPITSAAAAVHPGWVRITHCINVIAMFVMITSGWRIYDASPLFGFVIPPAVTIGDGLSGLAGALFWHFAAMWLLVINGIIYLTCGIVSGRFRRRCRAGRGPRSRHPSSPGRESAGRSSAPSH
jgi:thiosulfate reductase cytochrome b subunit